MSRGRKPKSRFYHLRMYTVGLNAERTAELIGVPVDVIHQWDQEGAPEMAEKLLMLWDRKHVGHEGWNGFLFSRGVLRFKNRRWTPKMILQCQECDEEIKALRNELEKLKTWRGLCTIFVNKVVDALPKIGCFPRLPPN
jgi:hypothetical protein